MKAEKQEADNKSTIEKIGCLLRQFASQYPFENLDVITKNTMPITETFLFQKFSQYRGGMCYELNPFLYLQLKEEGYDVKLVSGTIFNGNNWAIDGTHVMILLDLVDSIWLVDAGFGNQLALSPIEIGGSAVTSAAGSFRARRLQTQKGTHVLEMKSQERWIIKYAFSLTELPWEKLTNIKEQITFHEKSPFNSSPLIAQCFSDQTLSVTDKQMRIRFSKTGQQKLVKFNDPTEFMKAVKTLFSNSIFKKTSEYMKKAEKHS
ncbi:MAG: arylamine N-acetyltransferase [Bacillales bacterium]|nr:arylamine N-acetyltransferase [Bacillales bacterium]